MKKLKKFSTKNHILLYNKNKKVLNIDYNEKI